MILRTKNKIIYLKRYYFISVESFATSDIIIVSHKNQPFSCLQIGLCKTKLLCHVITIGAQKS